MKLDKKVVESGIVAAIAFAVVSTTTLSSYAAPLQAPYTNNSEIKSAADLEVQELVSLARNERNIVSAAYGDQSIVSLPEEEVQTYIKQGTTKRTAGISNLEVATAQSEDSEKVQENKNPEQQESSNTEKTTEANQKTEKATEANQKTDKEPAAKETEPAKSEQKSDINKKEEKAKSKWETRLLPEVEDYLNVRAEANSESAVVGKLYKGDLAEIVERGKEWSKITSGNVNGYVKNEYCVFDEEAAKLAKEVGTTYATTLTGGLRVREEASTKEDSKIIEVLEEGKKIEVDTEAEAVKGWVAVEINEQKAYISKEFVSVKLELGEGITIEEEQAAIAAAEKAKAEEAAAQAAAASTSASSAAPASDTSSTAPVAASADDVTLLAALIQCEAGAESYEGQLAVGAVVMNRVRRGYAGSISGVIYQSGQFTPASSGALSNRLSSGVSGSCMQAAQQAMSGVSNVGGATSFRQVSSGHAGIVIGNHVFF